MRQKEGSQGRPTEHSGVKPKRDTKWLHTNEMHDSELLLFNVTSQSSLLVLIDLQLNEKNLVMELDTGFAVPLICKSTYDKLFWNVELCLLHIVLQSYTSQPILLLGQFHVYVIYEDQKYIVIKDLDPFYLDGICCHIFALTGVVLSLLTLQIINEARFVLY